MNGSREIGISKGYHRRCRGVGNIEKQIKSIMGDARVIRDDGWYKRK